MTATAPRLPVACALGPDDLRARGADLLPGLVARADSRESLPNGFRWTFSLAPELLAELARVIEAERRCCPFLRFDLAIEPAGGPVSMDVTGPEGTRALLERLVG